MDPKQIIERVTHSVQARDMYLKYAQSLNEALQNTELHFTPSEILTTVYSVESSDCHNDTQDRHDELEQKLLEESTLHGKYADVMGWVIFVTEFYRVSRNLSNEEVIQLFSDYDIANFLVDTYPAFHTASERRAARMIDELIAEKNNGLSACSHQSNQEIRAEEQ